MASWLLLSVTGVAAGTAERYLRDWRPRVYLLCCTFNSYRCASAITSAASALRLSARLSLAISSMLPLTALFSSLCRNASAVGDLFRFSFLRSDGADRGRELARGLSPVDVQSPLK